MTVVELPYGTGHVTIEVPDGSTIVRARHKVALDDPYSAVAEALEHPLTGKPLSELMRHGMGVPGLRVAISIPDITRPMPHRDVLPALLDSLDGADVELLCATGTHRPASQEEMVDLVGSEIVQKFPIHQHRSDHKAGHLEVGRVEGTPIMIDRRWVEADLRLTTGFVEPHFFAGFSGGPKGVCPGLAATETILEAHHPRRIADPEATWLVTKGNPVHDFVREAVSLCPPDLSIDVTTTDDGHTSGVFVGTLPSSHEVACTEVLASAVLDVEGPFDVVVTTNGGHPLDRNLYQAVKGMDAAARIVADGGIIVMASPCGDGVPTEGRFASMLREAGTPDDLINGGADQDRWQAQVLGRVLRKAEVRLQSDALAATDIGVSGIQLVDDLQEAIDGAIETKGGANARVAVLVRGPLTVARSQAPDGAGE